MRRQQMVAVRSPIRVWCSAARTPGRPRRCATSTSHRASGGRAGGRARRAPAVRTSSHRAGQSRRSRSPRAGGTVGRLARALAHKPAGKRRFRDRAAHRGHLVLEAVGDPEENRVTTADVRHRRDQRRGVEPADFECAALVRPGAEIDAHADHALTAEIVVPAVVMIGARTSAIHPADERANRRTGGHRLDEREQPRIVHEEVEHASADTGRHLQFRGDPLVDELGECRRPHEPVNLLEQPRLDETGQLDAVLPIERVTQRGDIVAPLGAGPRQAKRLAFAGHDAHRGDGASWSARWSRPLARSSSASCSKSVRIVASPTSYWPRTAASASASVALSPIARHMSVPTASRPKYMPVSRFNNTVSPSSSRETTPSGTVARSSSEKAMRATFYPIAAAGPPRQTRANVAANHTSSTQLAIATITVASIPTIGTRIAGDACPAQPYVSARFSANVMLSAAETGANAGRCTAASVRNGIARKK